MAAFVLVSAKGSPGVTTTAAALAAMAGPDGSTLLVELDPSGGSVQIMTGQPVPVGLVEAGAQLRREVTPTALEENVTSLPDGVPGLLAPTAGAVAESVIESLGERWLPVLKGAAPVDFVVDAGRWEASQRSARRIVGADLIVIVCRPTLAGAEHARHLVDRLRATARRPAALVTVGSRPYPPAEVATHLDVPLVGSIAWDPRGVSSLWARGVTKGWQRSWLARSAASTLAGLAGIVGQRSSAQTSRREPSAPREPRHEVRP